MSSIMKSVIKQLFMGGIQMKYAKHFSITVLVLLTLLLTMVTLSYWADSEKSQVDSLVFTYDVEWVTDDAKASGKGVSGILNVGTSILDDLTDDVKKLIKVEVKFDKNINLDEEHVTVTVTVTLDEPANKEEYDLIAGKDLKLKLDFSVSEVE